MNNFLRVLVGIPLVLILLFVALLIGARFADGPLAIVAGGPFTSGELMPADEEPDWKFVHDIQEVEFQLMDPARSRTTWIVEVEGKAYIPSGYMTTWWGKIWKKWPLEAEKDGRILLRVGDKQYLRHLVRIEEGPLIAPIAAEIARKYPSASSLTPEAVSTGYLWLFELAPPG